MGRPWGLVVFTNEFVAKFDGSCRGAFRPPKVRNFGKMLKRKKISWLLVLFQLEPDLRRTHGQTINGVIFSGQPKNLQGRFLA